MLMQVRDYPNECSKISCRHDFINQRRKLDVATQPEPLIGLVWQKMRERNPRKSGNIATLA
jgi:hypothetical protein